MSVYLRSSVVPVPVRVLSDWHFRAGALDRMNPPWLGARVVQHPGAMVDGAVAVVRIPFLGFHREIAARHKDAIPGEGFTDVQERGPFRSWEHCHRFAPHGDGQSSVEDRVTFELPFPPIGPTLGTGFAMRMLERAFQWRHQRLHHDLPYAARSPEDHLRVAVSGTNGMVGSALVPFLSAGGCDVRRIVRTAPQRERGDIAWDQRAGTFDARALEGLDAVVHLAGANVAAGRWTPARKEAIRTSRVDSTRQLCATLAQLRNPPRVLVCASAIGYYGSRDPGEQLTEESARGAGFLAEGCVHWEAATEAAARAGIRVVNLRIGVVVGWSGGVLGALRMPAAWGLAGPIGSGRQVMSWIALDDLLGAVRFCITAPISGPLNAVAPTPVSNAEFVRTLGRVLRRPAFVRAPAFAVRALLGQMGEELLLGGSRVIPAALQRAGFRWSLPALEGALRFELGLPSQR